MNIQFVDLKKQYAPLKKEIISGIEEVLDGMLIGQLVNANKQSVDKLLPGVQWLVEDGGRK